MRAWRIQLLAFGLPLLMAADPAAQEKPPSPPPAGSISHSMGAPELSREDMELLQELKVLLEWDLLRDWDPEEDLPIPIDAPAPSGGKELP